jgi:hypothetical protein
MTRRLKGVNVYQEGVREFATGDRIQFTAKDKDLGVSNRDLGTITKLEPNQISVRLEGKDERTISFDPAKMRHFDHGYAVTSHVSQGLTERRVLANIDTESSRSLINTRLAYVAISRASDDARIYTNNAETLGNRLATDISKTAAVDFQRPRRAAEPSISQYSDSNHRAAAVASAYAERPNSTVVIAPDRAERQELNQLIRTDLQARGQVAPDSRSFRVHVEQDLSNPKSAAQYTPGDRIQYQRGSPNLEGIAHNSVAVVVATESRSNRLTVQTSSGDEVTYSPQLTRTMTAESKVYREEQREIAPGDRIQINEADPKQGIRKGDLGTVTAISETNELDVRLDRGKSVHLSEEQTRHIDYGYAVETIKAGAHERVLVTQETLEGNREVAALSRNAREVHLYTSDGSGSNHIRQSAPGLGVENTTFSIPEIDDLGTFSTLDFTIIGLGTPREIPAGVVDGHYFEVMGLRPVLGRLLTPSDDGPNAAGAIVLTYRFWKESLHGDPKILGKSVHLESFGGPRTATIIGVLEPSVPYPVATEIIANFVTSPHHLSTPPLAQPGSMRWKHYARSKSADNLS